MSNLRTPLQRARGLGSGKTGTEHFWIQRVTAVALVFLVPFLVWTLVCMAGSDADGARAIIARPWNAILLSAFAIAAFWHAKLGMQVVIEDYVHTRAMEVVLHLANMLLCTLGAIASVYAIARIALTA